MPQVRQHGFDFPSGRVGSDGRTACNGPAKDPVSGKAADPYEERRFCYPSCGVPPVAGETASEKPAVEPPPVQLPTSASAEVAARCGTARCAAERDRSGCAGSCARGAGNRGGGCAGGLHAF